MFIWLDALLASMVFKPCTKDKLAILIALPIRNKRNEPPWLIEMGFAFIMTSLF